MTVAAKTAATSSTRAGKKQLKALAAAAALEEKRKAKATADDSSSDSADADLVEQEEAEEDEKDKILAVLKRKQLSEAKLQKNLDRCSSRLIFLCAPPRQKPRPTWPSRR